MSTYAMSDIHGQQTAFNHMLRKIKFNDKDKLYLLGDYVDWGTNSMDLIQQIIQMQDTNFDIECLMGNHDLMMYKTIQTDFENIADVYFDYNFQVWQSNRGDETLQQYLQLNKEERAKIKKWISELRYFIPDVEVNGQKFYLCHSKPFVRGMSLEDVVWDRIEKGRLPRQFKDKYSDAILISGHTIVSNYGSIDENGKCKIYKDKTVKYINIDCGAKGLGIWKEYRLACLRLDDMSEFYVGN